MSSTLDSTKAYIYYGFSYTYIPFSLINSLNSSRNVAATSSLADTASPVILYFSVQTFPEPTNPYLQWLAWCHSFLGHPLLKSSYRLSAFWCTSGMCLPFMSFIHKVNAFSILTEHLALTMAVTLALWGATAKLAQISFSFFTISQ